MASLHLGRIGAGHYQAVLDDSDLVFSVKETPDGWIAEGHPDFDGRVWPSTAAFVADVEGGDR